MLRSDEEEDDDEESLRRGAVSGLEDEALLLMACVLLSTSAPKESFEEVFELCDRAGFCCALETCALAATSDVTPTTGDPLKTSSGQEVSKERASPSESHFIEQNQYFAEFVPEPWRPLQPRHFCRPGKNCPKLVARAIASPEGRLY